MLGKITKADIQLQTKFVKLINLYAQLVFFNMLEEEFIEPIRDVFYDIAEEVEVNFQQLYDAEIQTLESNNVQEPTKSIFDTLPEDRYVEIVKHSIAYELSKEYQNKVEKAVQAIQTLEDSVPDGMTKKAWSEKIKPQIEKLREERDTAKKMVTETKNNVNADEITKLAKVSFVFANGMVTNEEITMRLNHLLENVFYEEKQNEQFYPTPDDIIQKYIVSTLKKEQFTANPLVLEPSAGRGNIADAIRDAYPSARIDVCEINPLRREILELKNYNVVGDDFMKYGATRDESKGKNVLNDSVKNKYDFIVMNPPYNSGMDIRHVKRAFELLKPTGMIIAIISEGSAFSETRKDSVAFDMWLKENGVVSKEYIDNKTYSNMLDRPIAIGIGVITIRKPFPVVKSNDEPTYTMPEIVTADTNYKLEIDKNFVDAKVIVTNEHMITPPKFKGDQIMKKYGHLKWINDYVFFGVKKAIDSLDKDSGFLLADGTGAGKTIQCLMVAEHYYKKTGKPVLIFTVDDRVMQSGVFGDAEKLGMLVPDRVKMDDEDELGNPKNKIPKRPKDYDGLYDKISSKDYSKDYDNPVSVYAFNIKDPQLRDGINVTTYHNLSQWVGAEKESEELKSVTRERDRVNKEFAQKRKDALADLDKRFPKNPKTKRREPDGYKAAKEEEIGEIDSEQFEHPIYPALIKAKQALNDARLEAMKKWCGGACLIIFDEAHKVKNTGTGDGDASSQRAELARAITESGERIMFVTATPCDRPGDLLYLKRCGLFKSDEQFKNLMAEIGVYWIDPKYNKKGEMVAFGSWRFNDMDSVVSTRRLGEIFDTLYEDGNMLRRELEFRNLNVYMKKLSMPDNVLALMDAIEENLTTEDDDGKEKKNMADIYNRQLEELEEHKLDEVIRLTNDAISRGRNVLIFVKSVDTGKEDRAWSGKPKPGAVRILKEKFAKMYGEDKVGVIVGTHSEYEKYRRLENVTDFQSRKRRILIGTPASGGTGLNLDDTVGNAPRTMIVVTFPLSFIDVVQIVGRIVRAQTKSVSECHFIYAGNVPVDQWLANLLAIKFATLHATVKGEVSALNVEELREAEAGGESAAIANARKVSDEERKLNHSKFRKSNFRLEGWTLPNKVPLYLELSGTPKNTLISLGASKEQQSYLDTWIDNNQEFIEKWKLEKNPDSMHQKFNGRHYGRTFRDRDDCYALLNALLNVVDPESTAYNEPTKQIFKVGEKVVFTRSVGMNNVGVGTEGEVVNVRKTLLGKNDNGLSIFEYRYDVKISGSGQRVDKTYYEEVDDVIVKRVNITFLDFAQSRKVVFIKPGLMFREESGWNPSNKGEFQKYTYYYIPDYDYVQRYNDRSLDTYTWKLLARESSVEYSTDWRGVTNYYDPISIQHPTKEDFINENEGYRYGERILDIDEIRENVGGGVWEVLDKKAFFTYDGIKKEQVELKTMKDIYSADDVVLADNFADTKEKFEKLVEIFTLAKEQRLIDDEAIEQIEAVIDEIASEMNIAHGSGEVERFVMEPYKKERIRDSRLKEYRRQKKTKQGRHTLDYSNGTPKHAYSSGGHVEIVGEDEKYNEERYGAIFEDYDGDGIVNIDDAYPTDPSKQGKVESVALQPVFKKLIELKEKLNNVMYKAVDDLQRKAPKTADIYARTKTPYSIVKKLVDKRLLDQAKGLTDLVGTTIATDSYQDLVKVKNEIDSGLLGKVVDYDDFYTNPKAGYMAHHYIVKTDDGYLVEIQLKTKRMKRVNKVSHEFYKLGNLNAEGNLAVTELAHQADLGNEKAIKRFNDIMSPKYADLLRDIMTGKKELQLEQENDDDISLADTDLTKKGFYSRLDKAVQQLPEKVKKQSFLNTLKKSKEGVSSKELDLVNINKLLETKGDTITKDDVTKFLESNRYKIVEYVLGAFEDEDEEDAETIREIDKTLVSYYDEGKLSWNWGHTQEELADIARDFRSEYLNIIDKIDNEVIDEYGEDSEEYHEWEALKEKSEKFSDYLEKFEDVMFEDNDEALKNMSQMNVSEELVEFCKKHGITNPDDTDINNYTGVHSFEYWVEEKEDELWTEIEDKWEMYGSILNNKKGEKYDEKAEYMDSKFCDFLGRSGEYKEYLYRLSKDKRFFEENDFIFSSQHFEESGNNVNLLGHYRSVTISNAKMTGGIKTTYAIEEIQSDWSQNLDKRHLSPFPTNSDFMEFVTKVIIVNAVKDGADTIVFTSGEMQNKRWNKVYAKLKHISWSKNNKGQYVCKVTTENNEKETIVLEENELVSHLGKQVAIQILEKDSGEMDLDSGMFYGDKGFIEMYGSTEQNTIGIIGKKFNDLLKPYGERVTVQKFYDNDVFGFTIPEKLKEKIMNDEHSFSLMDNMSLPDTYKRALRRESYNDEQYNDLVKVYEKAYQSGFTYDATGNVAQGDEIAFAESVFTGSHRNARFSHFELISGRIVKDSYGADKQQHTFTIETASGEKKLRKGRNVYKYLTLRKERDRDERDKALEEKYKRGNAARAARQTRKENN